MAKRADPGDERRLVNRAISGDAGAFGQLYDRYLDQIYRYIFFRVSDIAEAEDLTEEVFVRAWEALPDYTPTTGASLSSWLYRIAHNLVVDFYRKRSQWEDKNPLFAVKEQPPSLEEMVGTKQAVGRALEAMKRLSEVEQSVLLLRFVEGLSYRDIAEIVDKSEGACRVIQYRALSTLRDHLKEEHTTSYE